jgi:hypothetical protein
VVEGRIVLVTGGNTYAAHPALAGNNDAPHLDAELVVKGEERVIHLLVDTGASSTTINLGLIADEPHKLWNLAQDKGEVSLGVGGAWPQRTLPPSSLKVETEAGDQVEIPLPQAAVMPPFRLVRRDRGGRICKTDGIMKARTIGQNEELTAYQAPSLLGRDFFRANKLALGWDPNGSSFITLEMPEAPKPTPVAGVAGAILPQTGNV